MQNYREAETKLNGRTRRKLENNTYLERRSDTAIAVKLHATDVVTYCADGTVTLNSGGWKTVTTKDRLNRYTPVRIWTERGVWYVSLNGREKTQVYQDGMTYRDEILSGTDTPPTNLNKDKRAIGNYAKGFVEALQAGKVPAPGAGDCWLCSMKEVKTGRPLGECSQDHSHIRSHLEEGYYVPSLAYHALETFGASIAARQTLWAATHGELDKAWPGGVGYGQIQTMIRRYVSRQLGYQA